MSIDDFKTIKTKRDYVLARVSLDLHSHMKHLSGIQILLNFIDKEILPTNKYFLTGLQRILTPEELRNFKQPKKQRYVNTR